MTDDWEADRGWYAARPWIGRALELWGERVLTKTSDELKTMVEKHDARKKAANATESK